MSQYNGYAPENVQPPAGPVPPPMEWDSSGVPMPPEKKKRNKGAAVWMGVIGVVAFLLGMGVADDGGAVRDLESANAALAGDVEVLSTEVTEMEEARVEADAAVEATAAEQEALQITLDDRTVELDEREAALDLRTTEVDGRTADLDAREAALDTREGELDARSAELDKRETAVEKSEQTSSSSSSGSSSSSSSSSGSSGTSTNVYYDNCSAARAAGAAPVYRGDPGYGTHLDRDRDGVGCE
jgi:hypothetical protein